jgi:hypothetical protein
VEPEDALRAARLRVFDNLRAVAASPDESTSLIASLARGEQ